MSDKFDGATVLITGANGGLGVQFVEQALTRGAAKVYASARTPREWSDPRVIPLALDVTDEASASAAAEAAADTTILINNAGVAGSGALTSGSVADLRRVMETNFFGTVIVSREFAPVLKRNGGGVILNVLSVLSWIGLAGGYSASKAALWSATNSLRLELLPQGTHVIGLHLGYADTPMTAGIDSPMNDPANVVRTAYDGVESGDYEILADELSIGVKAGLSGSLEGLYPQLRRTPDSVASV